MRLAPCRGFPGAFSRSWPTAEGSNVGRTHERSGLVGELLDQFSQACRGYAFQRAFLVSPYPRDICG